ncbi:MAG: hypothetical protein Q8K60_05555 [Parachlamydiaceae bacterium]|nr:hypothetical protein [Parachlamydiaceae bacterium]
MNPVTVALRLRKKAANAAKVCSHRRQPVEKSKINMSRDNGGRRRQRTLNVILTIKYNLKFKTNIVLSLFCRRYHGSYLFLIFPQADACG